MNAKIAELIFHRVRDVAPNKVYVVPMHYSGYLYLRLDTRFSVLLNLTYDLDPRLWLNISRKINTPSVFKYMTFRTS